MTGLIQWWCHLIGITDAGSIQIAIGIAGGGSALFVAFFLVYCVVMIPLALFSPFWRDH